MNIIINAENSIFVKTLQYFVEFRIHNLFEKKNYVTT